MNNESQPHRHVQGSGSGSGHCYRCHRLGHLSKGNPSDSHNMSSLYNYVAGCTQQPVKNPAVKMSSGNSSSNLETTQQGQCQKLSGSGTSFRFHEETAVDGEDDNSAVNSENGRTTDSLQSGTSSRGTLDPSAVSFTLRSRSRRSR